VADSKNMSAYGQKKSFDDDPNDFNTDLQQRQLKDAISEYQLYKQQKLNEQQEDDNLTEQVTNSYNDEDKDLYEQNIKQRALQQYRDGINRMKYGE
jgi:hypothetical protein